MKLKFLFSVEVMEDIFRKSSFSIIKTVKVPFLYHQNLLIRDTLSFIDFQHFLSFKIRFTFLGQITL